MFHAFNEDIIHRYENRLFSHELWLKLLEAILNDHSLIENNINFQKLHENLVNVSENCNDNGLIFSIHAHLWGGIYPLLKFGHSDVHQKILNELVRGEKIASLVFTDDKKSPVTCLKRPDGSYVLNGTKNYITNATIADYFIVYVKKQNSLMNAFILEKKTLGMSIGSNLNLSGLNTSPNANVFFKDCVVTSNYLIGSENEGSNIFNSCVEKERLFVMSSILGRFKSLHKLITKITDENLIDKSIYVTDILSEIDSAIHISENEINKNLIKILNKQSIFISSAEAKCLISPLYQEITRKTIQALGAIGLDQKLGIERENRDALSSTIYSGRQEVLKMIISKCKD